MRYELSGVVDSWSQGNVVAVSKTHETVPILAMVAGHPFQDMFGQSIASMTQPRSFGDAIIPSGGSPLNQMFNPVDSEMDRIAATIRTNPCPVMP